MKAVSFYALPLLLFSGMSLAVDLPTLPSQHDASPHNFFLSSGTKLGSSDSFDTWNIDSGYSYSIFDSLDVYIAARLSNSHGSIDQGF